MVHNPKFEEKGSLTLSNSLLRLLHTQHVNRHLIQLSVHVAGEILDNHDIVIHLSLSYG